MLLVNVELQEEAGLSPGNVNREPSSGVGLRLLCLRKPHRLTLVPREGNCVAAALQLVSAETSNDRRQVLEMEKKPEITELKEHLIK